MKATAISVSKRVRSALLGIGLLLAFSLGTAPVLAQVSGQTDIDISFPPLIILFYYSNVDVTITAADLEGVVLTGANPVDVGTTAGSGFTPDLNIDTTTNFTSPTAVNLDLLRSWGIRAVGNGNDVQVSVNTACGTCSTTLTHSTVPANTISITGVEVTSPTGGAFGSSSVNVTPAGLGTAITGDVRLVLDLTGADISGDYEDGVFEISAVSL